MKKNNHPALSKVRVWLVITKIMVIAALLFICFPPSMKVWEQSDSIPSEYTSFEYLLKEIDQDLFLLLIITVLIFVLSELTRELEKIQTDPKITVDSQEFRN